MTNLNSELPNVSFDLGTLEGGNDSFVRFERERIQPDKEQHYRILPPFGAESSGALFHRYAIHWGLTGERGQQKPVSCSYSTEGFCPICKKVWEAEDEMKRAQEAGDQGMVKDLTTYLKTWRARRFFVYNAVTTDGRVVILEIPKTAQDQLMELVKDCVYKKGYDPTSLSDGVWFTFSKSGKGFKTEYKVVVKKVVVDAKEGLEKPDREPISDDLAARVMEQVKEAGHEDGPLYDIHDLYEPRGSRELQGFMEGGLVPDKKAELKLADTLGKGPVEDDIPDSVTAKPTDAASEVERLNKLQSSEA